MNRLGPTILGGAAALCATVAMIQPALGQGGASALKGHDTNAPIDVAADRIEVQDRADRAIFSGNVQVRQGNMHLAASRITVAYANAGGIEVERVEASGGVTLRSPSETARGQFAIYDTGRRLVTMIGGVTLTRGESNVRGGRLVLDLTTGRAVLDGGAPGSPGQTGRVTGRFTVPQRGN
jgi:lipopolysaccharide export system protein LptA